MQGNEDALWNGPTASCVRYYTYKSHVMLNNTIKEALRQVAQKYDDHYCIIQRCVNPLVKTNKTQLSW